MSDNKEAELAAKAAAEVVAKEKEALLNAEVKSLSKDDFRDIVTEMFAKQAESLEKRRKAAEFDDSEENQFKYAETQKRDAQITFFKHLVDGNKSGLRKLQSQYSSKYLKESTGDIGGYLVPEEFSTEVLRYMDTYSEIRQNARVLTMNTDVMRLNTLATKPSVFKTSEAAAISGTRVTFGEPVLTLEKRAAIIPWTYELQEDAEVQLLSLVQEELGEALALAEQEDFINQTGGVTGSDGLLQVAGVTVVAMASGDTAFADITWDYLLDMENALMEINKPEAKNGKFYMSSYVWNALRKLKSSGDGNYFTPFAPQSTNPMTSWGREVVIINEMPGSSDSAANKKFVIYGDLKKHAFIGDRGGLRITLHEEGTVKDYLGNDVNLITQDSKALRVVKRTAFTTALQNGIVVLRTAAS